MMKQFNARKPWQKGGHFIDDIFKCILFNKSFHILMEVSSEFVPNINQNTNNSIQEMYFKMPFVKFRPFLSRRRWVNLKTLVSCRQSPLRPLPSIIIIQSPQTTAWRNTIHCIPSMYGFIWFDEKMSTCCKGILQAIYQQILIRWQWTVVFP